MSDLEIVLASDHAGYPLKNELYHFLSDQGYQCTDLGVNEPHSVDYPDFAQKLAESLLNHELRRGLLVCGSGIGISIAANRYHHIRAALIHDSLGAKLSRQHNNANVIVFGARLIGIDTAKEALTLFLNTAFEGGRHIARVEKLTSLNSSSLKV